MKNFLIGLLYIAIGVAILAAIAVYLQRSAEDPVKIRESVMQACREPVAVWFQDDKTGAWSCSHIPEGR